MAGYSDEGLTTLHSSSFYEGMSLVSRLVEMVFRKQTTDAVPGPMRGVTGFAPRRELNTGIMNGKVMLSSC